MTWLVPHLEEPGKELSFSGVVEYHVINSKNGPQFFTAPQTHSLFHVTLQRPSTLGGSFWLPLHSGLRHMACFGSVVYQLFGWGWGKSWFIVFADCFLLHSTSDIISDSQSIWIFNNRLLQTGGASPSKLLLWANRLLVNITQTQV